MDTEHALALGIAIGFAAAALAALYPGLRSIWQRRNDPPGLSHWAGGRMPAWPKGMIGSVPADREPIGPSLPKVVGTRERKAAGEVVGIGRRRAG